MDRQRLNVSKFPLSFKHMHLTTPTSPSPSPSPPLPLQYIQKGIAFFSKFAFLRSYLCSIYVPPGPGVRKAFWFSIWALRPWRCWIKCMQGSEIAIVSHWEMDFFIVNDIAIWTPVSYTGALRLTIEYPILQSICERSYSSLLPRRGMWSRNCGQQELN